MAKVTRLTALEILRPLIKDKFNFFNFVKVRFERAYTALFDTTVIFYEFSEAFVLFSIIKFIFIMKENFRTRVDKRFRLLGHFGESRRRTIGRRKQGF